MYLVFLKYSQHIENNFTNKKGLPLDLHGQKVSHEIITRHVDMSQPHSKPKIGSRRGCRIQSKGIPGGLKVLIAVMDITKNPDRFLSGFVTPLTQRLPPLNNFQTWLDVSQGS